MSLLLANQGGGAPQTGTPGAAIRSWVIPVVSVLLGAVTASPAAATRQWTVPTPSVSVGAVTATPAPASRSWTVPTPTVSLGAVVASPAPAVRTWSVPTPSVSLGALTAIPDSAVRTWVALDATLSVSGPQTAIPLPAVRTWVAKDAILSEASPVVETGFGGSSRLPKYKAPRYTVTVTVPPAIRDWVVPPVTVRLGMVRLLPAPAIRIWVALDPSVIVAPDPGEELLILLLSEKG